MPLRDLPTAWAEELRLLLRERTKKSRPVTFLTLSSSLQGGAVGAPPQVENRGGLATLAGASCLLGRLGQRRALVGLLRRVGLVARPGLGRRNVGPCVPRTAAFGRALAARPGQRPRCRRFRLECR